MDKTAIQPLIQRLKGLSINESLKSLLSAFPNKVTFSTSFSYEDQVITHIILNEHLPVKIFTLDTGRLFEETYYTWSRTNERYNTIISAYYPNYGKVEDFLIKNGPNAFYESYEKRKECCFIRKVEPLKRALAENAVWITGLRAEHSPDRKDLEILEWDPVNQIIKYNPLLHWETKDVKEFIYRFNIPYNPLHDKGYDSIGCAPCTRAIKPGENFRAGRWWWENNTKKECGLHSQNINS